MISFLRQIVEHGGFYRNSDQTWITLQRIQFVGACNPPTDPGRKPLSHRYNTCNTQDLYTGVYVLVCELVLREWWECEGVYIEPGLCSLTLYKVPYHYA